jgi:hypothetical protein
MVYFFFVLLYKYCATSVADPSPSIAAMPVGDSPEDLKGETKPHHS